ncbi:MAG TPA: HEAT repeat domain-containing protein, partial [Myxococcales bacterium]|nr:HEAT repeat domain-containing protein [Myxococcales bacterium]
MNSPAARERAAAVRTLDPNDDAGYSALTRAVHDGAAPVRVEVAAALARSKRAEATDALATLLRDADDPVRIAAAKALGQRCGERGEAYLRMAFARSGAAVRARVVEALEACGKPPQDTLGREEAELRRKAMKLLDDPAAAQRARGAHELGLLCREQDQPPLLKLLDDADGVAVAAAERALGDCGVQAAVPRVVKLLDEGGEVGAAGAEALQALGVAGQAKPQLRR